MTTLGRWIGWLFIAALTFTAFRPTTTHAQTPLYADRLGTESLRFGASAGSGTRWVPQTNQVTASAGFGGRVALTCSGLNYSGFLSTFDVNDWLNDLKSQFIAGAQSADSRAVLVQ